MSALRKRKGIDFCSDGSAQSSWSGVQPCWFLLAFSKCVCFRHEESLPSVISATALMLTSWVFLLHPALLLVSYLWFSLPCITSQLLSCWVKCTSSFFFLFPPSSPTAGSFPVQQPWPYLQFLPFPPLQLTLLVNSALFLLLHPPKAGHTSCRVCCHFFPCLPQLLSFLASFVFVPVQEADRFWLAD